MKTAREIRHEFLDFFTKKHGHTYAPSSPVVPHDDPTLLFTNAGMNQFKDVFLGLGSRPYTRAVNTQKCIRAGGKHNDLEDVGRDTYHHTFFEMLGNWSFGDYFKKEAIDWAWELLTKVWGLDPARMHATYFGGNEKDGLAPDDEAKMLWLKYLPAERVHPGSMKDNFWEMGDTGPCGPCSEIHIDLTEDFSGGKMVNAGDARVIEVWNLVFIQFNRESGGALSPLPAKHVDTGMGFERIVAVIQGKKSNYDTDIFTPLFDAIRQISGVRPYGGKLPSTGSGQGDDNIDTAYRVIADHARTLTFALTDGALPSNEGRGYVLRRILRRAVRFGRQHLNIEAPFLHKLVATVVEQMGDFFPELVKNPKGVSATILEEEESFGKTLDRGIELFEEFAIQSQEQLTNSDDDALAYGEKQFNVMSSQDHPDGRTRFDTVIDWRDFDRNRRPVIPGDEAFFLYDTFGFPIDLTELMAAEKGFTVDIEGFNARMEKARQRSRADGGKTGGLKESLVSFLQKNPLPATQFIGYEQTVIDGLRLLKVLAERGGSYVPTQDLKVGESAVIVVDKTPFYAESGGQVGDSGFIRSSDGTLFRVTDTQRYGDVFFHFGVAAERRPDDSLGRQPQEGDAPLHTLFSVAAPEGRQNPLTMEVDNTRRSAITQHHTTTHLMNWALREVLGEGVQQKGSLVDPEKTRFDYSHNKPLTPDEAAHVQQLVNQKIEDKLPIFAETVPQEDALKIQSLRAVFGEKYPPRVRVVSIGVPVAQLLQNPANQEWRQYSIEFCGGTHLRSTEEASRFAILSEEGVAKGVRRITAVAGGRAIVAFEKARELRQRADALSQHDPASLAHELHDLTEIIDSTPLPITERTALREKLAVLHEIVKRQAKEAQRDAEGGVVDAARRLAEGSGDGPIIAQVEGADAKSLRTAMDVIRKKRPEVPMLLAAVADGKVAFLAAVPEAWIARGLKAGDWVREAAVATGGSGGGRPDMAQAGGKQPEKLADALDAARKFVQSKIG